MSSIFVLLFKWDIESGSLFPFQQTVDVLGNCMKQACHQKRMLFLKKILAIKAGTYNLKPPLRIGSLDSKHCNYVLWDNISLTRRCNNSSICTYLLNGTEL